MSANEVTLRLSDSDLDRLDDLIRWEHDGGGTGQELADMARDLLAEVRASRAREAVNRLDWSQLEHGEAPSNDEIVRAVLSAVCGWAGGDRR